MDLEILNRIIKEKNITKTHPDPWVNHAVVRPQVLDYMDNSAKLEVTRSFGDALKTLTPTTNHLPLEYFNNRELTLEDIKHFRSLMGIWHTIIFCPDDVGVSMTEKQANIFNVTDDLFWINDIFKVPFDLYDDLLKRGIQLAYDFAKSEHMDPYNFPGWQELSDDLEARKNELQKRPEYAHGFVRF